MDRIREEGDAIVGCVTPSVTQPTIAPVLS
jgi:hypothetical protein